uniref:Uncharacterized protein n=1 Tax=Romanomermis culicivorax TaxID=13658 RepID=A0A915J3Z7_ROMCU
MWAKGKYEIATSSLVGNVYLQTESELKTFALHAITYSESTGIQTSKKFDIATNKCKEYW